MSSKRRADKELTSDNWDVEDEPEEKGIFRVASEEVLKNRVIRTAKRRIASGITDVERPSTFSGFTGFGVKKTDERKTGFSFVSSDLKGEDTVNTLRDTDAKMMFAFSSGSNSAKAAPLSLASNLSSFMTSDSGKSTLSSVSAKSDNADSASKLSTLSSKLKNVANEGRTVLPQSAESRSSSATPTEDEIFFKKLRSLNLLCAEWIIKHLNENLSYILTPIFDDYKKHLTQLREERRLSSSTCKKAKVEMPETRVSKEPEPIKSQNMPENGPKEMPPKLNFGTGSFLSSKENNTSKLVKPTLSTNKEETSSFKFFSPDKKDENPKTFSFIPAETKFDSGFFKFKAGSESSSTTSITNETAESTPSSFFSFKPTTNSMFGQNATPKVDDDTKEEDDGPPPVEDVTIKEEGSVYDKKCKVFIKKDSNFVDHGVGFLFLKLVGDDKKCQVIVRANNKLANILINVLLSASIPVQRMGKNNVMIICCPTPETKQPTSVLLKVKTSDDAEELLNALNKHRK